MVVYADMVWKYQLAAASPSPRRALRALVLREFAETAADCNRILSDLEQLRLHLREDGQDEDVVVDVMETIEGSARPGHDRSSLRRPVTGRADMQLAGVLLRG